MIKGLYGKFRVAGQVQSKGRWHDTNPRVTYSIQVTKQVTRGEGQDNENDALRHLVDGSDVDGSRRERMRHKELRSDPDNPAGGTL